MHFIVWNESLSVGNDEIDAEHKQWIKYINQLHEEIEQKSDYKVLSKVMDQIKDYAKAHFQNEESIFSPTDYPDTENHKKLHREFLEELDLLSDLHSSKTTDALTFDALLSLKKWLLNHVQTVDQQYVPYIKKRS